MAVFLIAQLSIRDRERYSEYEKGFMDILNRYEGKILVVDENPRSLEGEWPYDRTVLLEFESEAKAGAWYHSDAYQQLVQHRFASSDGNIVMVRGF